MYVCFWKKYHCYYEEKHNVQKCGCHSDLMTSKWAVCFETKSLRSFHCTQF